MSNEAPGSGTLGRVDHAVVRFEDVLDGAVADDATAPRAADGPEHGAGASRPGAMHHPEGSLPGDGSHVALAALHHVQAPGLPEQQAVPVAQAGPASSVAADPPAPVRVEGASLAVRGDRVLHDVLHDVPLPGRIEGIEGASPTGRAYRNTEATGASSGGAGARDEVPGSAGDGLVVGDPRDVPAHAWVPPKLDTAAALTLPDPRDVPAGASPDARRHATNEAGATEREAPASEPAGAPRGPIAPGAPAPSGSLRGMSVQGGPPEDTSVPGGPPNAMPAPGRFLQAAPVPAGPPQSTPAPGEPAAPAERVPPGASQPTAAPHEGFSDAAMPSVSSSRPRFEGGGLPARVGRQQGGGSGTTDAPPPGVSRQGSPSSRPPAVPDARLDDAPSFGPAAEEPSGQRTTAVHELPEGIARAGARMAAADPSRQPFASHVEALSGPGPRASGSASPGLPSGNAGASEPWWGAWGAGEAPPVADQVGPLLATLASGPDGTRTAGLSLVPPGLGVLRAEVESRAGQVAVRLWAASEAGYRALAAAAHELAASLAHAGLEVASVEVHHTARAGTGSSSDGNRREAGTVQRRRASTWPTQGRSVTRTMSRPRSRHCPSGAGSWM
jgi:flagellar hook-length control protein FliK